MSNQCWSLCNTSLHDSATWSVLPEAAHSSKQQIFIVYSAHKSFPSGCVCFRSDKRGFCRWNNTAICQELFLVILAMNRPWDPGIIMATAWGQDVFRGAGNVMTHVWPRRSPVCLSQLPKMKPTYPAWLKPKHPLYKA
jgi:hypothetical protein